MSNEVPNPSVQVKSFRFFTKKNGPHLYFYIKVEFECPDDCEADEPVFRQSLVYVFDKKIRDVSNAAAVYLGLEPDSISFSRWPGYNFGPWSDFDAVQPLQLWNAV